MSTVLVAEDQEAIRLLRAEDGENDMSSTQTRHAWEERHERDGRFYRALVARSGDALTVPAADGTVRYVSDGVERLLGRTAAEVTGRSAFDFVHPDDVDVARERFARPVAGGAASSPPASESLRLRARSQSGEWRWLEVTAASWFDDPAVGA